MNADNQSPAGNDRPCILDSAKCSMEVGGVGPLEAFKKNNFKKSQQCVRYSASHSNTNLEKEAKGICRILSLRVRQSLLIKTTFNPGVRRPRAAGITPHLQYIQ